MSKTSTKIQFNINLWSAQIDWNHEKKHEVLWKLFLL